MWAFLFYMSQMHLPFKIVSKVNFSARRGRFFINGLLMKTTRSAIAVFMLFSVLSTDALSSVQINEDLEQSARQATERYAQSVKKPMPELEDYTYGMNLDVGKLVYVSPNVRYCGNVKSMMAYEDSKGELHMVRYLVKGECVNSR